MRRFAVFEGGRRILTRLVCMHGASWMVIWVERELMGLVGGVLLCVYDCYVVVLCTRLTSS